MIYRYDLHIHSALSPCAENDMTPATIVGQAMLSGLNFVAIADHNAIRNVKVAMDCGEAYGVKVVPAMELQTSEEIHILCLFENLNDLESFYYDIEFGKIKNKKEIFGDQLIMDEDDNVIGEEEILLLQSANISSTKVKGLCQKHNGVAIPAHIDREMNGMLQILGCVPDEFNVVEISSLATEEFIELYKDRKIIVDSDAHTLDRISLKGKVELEEYSVKALIEYLKG